jgi:uncharacterized protein YndB with AHSA1/START domain
MTDRDANTLVIRRRIDAVAERVFDAWTRPEHLRHWWGPEGVRCPEASVDLRPGGAYRIANEFEDGRVLWISGEFEVVEPPRKLVYSWRLEPWRGEPERVTVSFEPMGDATEVVVTHERISDAKVREEHEAGWQGCLAGLEKYLASKGSAGRP